MLSHIILRKQEMPNREFREKIKPFVAEGYNKRILDIRQAGEVLILMKENGLDLKRYHVKEITCMGKEFIGTTSKDHALDTLSLLYNCYMNELNLFMFKSYAYKCSADVNEVLVNGLDVGKDITMLLDYSKMDSLEARNFAGAVISGIDVKEAMQYARFIGDVKIGDYIKLRKHLSPKEALEFCQNFEPNTCILLTEVVMESLQLSFNDAFNIVNALGYASLGEFEDINKFIDKRIATEVLDRYRNYLQLFTGQSYDNYIHNAVWEACYLCNRPMISTYLLKDIDTVGNVRQLVYCILKGIDVEVYLSMNLGSHQLYETLSTLGRAYESSHKEHLGLEFITPSLKQG